MKEEEREEKIRKLREISKKDRKEIEEAQSLVKGTEDIIKERPIKEEVKVPEIEAHIEEIIRPQQRRDYSAEEELTREERRETRLEETVEREHEERRPERGTAQAQYEIFKQEFKEQSPEEIYSAVRNVYQRIREGREGPTPEDMNRVNAAMYEAHRREHGMISEDVSQKLVITERIGSWISRMYEH